MLRSLGLFLFFLATASLAQQEDLKNYKVYMTRYNFTEAHCDHDTDTEITAQMQASVSSSTHGYFNRVVNRVTLDPSTRKLRIGASPRDLGWCDKYCRCEAILMCKIGCYCADSCTDCGCDRRMEEEPSFLWPQEDVESSLSLEGVVEVITAGEEEGVRQLENSEDEDCPTWNLERGRKLLTSDEMDGIMTCSASKALKELARDLREQRGNNCLGNPEDLEVHAKTDSDLIVIYAEDMAAIDIGTAGDYVILTKSGIATAPTSAITGDIGVSPIAFTAMTGFSFIAAGSTLEYSVSAQLTGHAFAANSGGTVPAKLSVAVSAMEAAYTDAAGRVSPGEVRIDLGGGILGGAFGGENAPLTAGIYKFTTGISISTDIYFNGSATDIFIIQITANLIQAANKKVVLTGGALAKNIFWQVAGYVEVGAGAHLEGILLVATHVNFLGGSSLNGRVLAQTACNLQMATITEPSP
jgi:hypothetical protein